MADEQVPATTPQPEPAPEAQPAPAPDPRDEELARLRDEKQRQQASYSDLQRKYQLQYERNNASTALMSEMAENVRLLRESQTALVKSTMGEEQASALDARMKASTEESQRRTAASQAMTFIEAQTRVMTQSLQKAGVDTTSIDWTGGNAGSVAEWQERVTQSADKAIAASREKYLKAVESASAKAKEAAKVEADKIADKELAKAGVGRIDSAKGPGTTIKQRIDALDPKSPEFAQMIAQARRGELTKL